MSAGRDDGPDRVDVDGRAADHRAKVVVGQVGELTSAENPVERRRFFLTREQLPWLPVAEAAFLLWILAALVAVWVLVALALGIL
jgi:hypothetical protein